jgi:hypothetical protein
MCARRERGSLSSQVHETEDVMSKQNNTTAAKAAEANLMRFNQEAFETVLEMQMSFLETSRRFATEFTSFVARRAEADTEDFTRFAAAGSPSELLQMQFEHMRTMFTDYAREVSRLFELAGETVKESGEALRSSSLEDPPVRKAG